MEMDGGMATVVSAFPSRGVFSADNKAVRWWTLTTSMFPLPTSTRVYLKRPRSGTVFN